MTYELYHHGIKGMKWGVRRYQNTDGSYTAAGKSRRSSSGSGKSGMSSKTKSRLKTAAKVAGAAALAGGAAYAISRRSGSGTTALATVPHNTGLTKSSSGHRSSASKLRMNAATSASRTAIGGKTVQALPGNVSNNSNWKRNAAIAGGVAGALGGVAAVKRTTSKKKKNQNDEEETETKRTNTKKRNNRR